MQTLVEWRNDIVAYDSFSQEKESPETAIRRSTGGGTAEHSIWRVNTARGCFNGGLARDAIIERLP